MFLQGVRWSVTTAFVVLWLIVGAHDARQQKIPHRHLSWIVGLSLLTYLALMLDSAAGSRGWTSPYLFSGFYRDALLHAALSICAALALWRLRMWPAGDAKLFVALSTLVPVTMFSSGFDPRRSCLFVLVNVFVPAAVFTVARAAEFVWRLYLNEQRRALAYAGWKRLRAHWAETAPSAAREALGRLESKLSRWREDPLALLLGLLSWAGSMAFASAVAVIVSRAAPSAIVQSGLCYLAMLGFGRAASGRRRVPISALSFLGVAMLAVSGGPTLVRQWLPFLGTLTVFSLFIRIGTGLVRRLLEERGLIVAPLFMLAGWLPLGLLFSFGSQWSRLLIEWALLGSLFGVGRVLIAILEREDCPKIDPAELRPYALLAPAFVEELRGDPEFFEEHLEPLYADGLTPEQAEAIRRWCADRRVEFVRLHSTVSFANWIFFGFFLTWFFPVSILRPFPWYGR